MSANTATASLVNNGTLNIRANAEAYGGATAFAYAYNYSAISQIATGSGNFDTASAIITNTSSLTLNILATATAVATNGDASATAYIYYAIDQDVDTADTAIAEINNSGTINIVASADARGTNYAYAYAENYSAIYSQTASASGNQFEASASITNDGTLNIDAIAFASATNGLASATAYNSYAIDDQDASNGAVTTATITNNGTLNIRAMAQAMGTATAVTTPVYAYAYNYSAISQVADANSDPGDMASVVLTNTSDLSLNIIAMATATAYGGAAEAEATVYYAIEQNANQADYATAEITNSGAINIIAQAKAYGSSDAYAFAYNYSAIDDQDVDSANNNILASATIVNDGTFNIDAIAFASATNGSASAEATVYYAIDQDAEDAELTETVLTNNGTLNIRAMAEAVADTYAYAFAYNYSAIYQSASAGGNPGDVAQASITNTSSLTMRILAQATASGTSAEATATNYNPIYQYAFDADESYATLDNSGSLYIQAIANAYGTTDAYAYAYNYYGIYQSATTSGNDLVAHASLNNSGSLSISADAYAISSGATASAYAYITYAISQYAFNADDTTASLTNSSNLSIWADADAMVTGSSGFAYASASVETGIYQSADADGNLSATASVNNSSTLSIWAEADAIGGDTATAYAYVFYPISQYAYDGDTVLASIDNSGDLLISADAYAEAFDAYAYAYVSDIYQSVSANAGGDATASFVNTGTVNITAKAVALGQHDGLTTTSATADAYAYAYGVEQYLLAGGEPSMVAQFHNSSSFNVSAYAFASANAGTAANASYAYASASGYSAYAPNAGDTLEMDFNNSGDFNIYATAMVGGTGAGSAYAYGAYIGAETLTGSFQNTGDMTIMAYSPNGFADAFGMGIYTDDGSGGSFMNMGRLGAFAYGSSALATAVYFGNFFGGGTQTLTFSNHGGWVGAVENTGTYDMHGTAFNAENANYPVLLDFQGYNGSSGSVFGDIVFKPTDMIYVTNGTTYFDGTINPDAANEGFVDIFDDGKFVLVNNQEIGPTLSYVDELEVFADGTLGFQIDADPDVSRIDANTATLDGTIMVSALAGLYAASQTYQDVIDADTLFGTFATEMINTPLLDLVVDYDGADNVDLTVTRNAFDAVAGLTRNQMAVAGGIESTYGAITPGTPYGDLISEFFTLGNAQYRDALDEVSGAEYAGALQFASGSFNLFHDAVNNRVNSAHSNGGASSTSGFLNTLFAGSGSPSNNNNAWWVRVAGGWGDQDGDGNSPGYDYSQVSALIGVDGQINDNVLIGIAGGIYAPGDLDFDNGDRIDQDTGFQIGAYAQYDPGTYYVRGFVGYGSWDANATRTLTIGGLSGVNTSSFNVHAWNVSGEVGYDLVMTSATITPFAGLSYTHASLGNYSESGFAASALSGSGDADQFDGIIGVRASGMEYASGGMTITPEGAIGWVQNFSGETSVTNTLINAPAGTNFTVFGPEHGGGLFLDLGATVGVNTNTSFTFGYAGEFGTDYNEHSAFGKFLMKF